MPGTLPTDKVTCPFKKKCNACLALTVLAGSSSCLPVITDQLIGGDGHLQVSQTSEQLLELVNRSARRPAAATAAPSVKPEAAPRQRADLNQVLVVL